MLQVVCEGLNRSEACPLRHGEIEAINGNRCSTARPRNYGWTSCVSGATFPLLPKGVEHIGKRMEANESGMRETSFGAAMP
jgi:hypothetical protein